jgi:hypothetical protein
MESAIAALSSAARMQLEEGEVHVTALPVQASAATSGTRAGSSNGDSGTVAPTTSKSRNDRSINDSTTVAAAAAASTTERADAAVSGSLKPAAAVQSARASDGAFTAALSSRVAPANKPAVLKMRKQRVTLADTVPQGEPKRELKRARHEDANPAAVAPATAAQSPRDTGTVPQTD